MLANMLDFLHELKSICQTISDELLHSTSLMAKGEPSKAIKRHLARLSLRLTVNKQEHGSESWSIPESLLLNTKRTWNDKSSGSWSIACREAIRSHRWSRKEPPAWTAAARNYWRCSREQQGTRLVVERKDRLTRFGFHYLGTLLEIQGRTIEVVNVAENDKEDLIADIVAIVYSFTSRL